MTAMTALADVLAVFARSDLAPGTDPLWYRWATVTAAHVLLGVWLSLVPGRWAWSFMALWLAKELLFDIPHGGSLLVMLDSLADLCAAVLGIGLGRWMQPSRAMNAADQANRK
jgi:hypothetical protein